jgi:hypothetical protein
MTGQSVIDYRKVEVEPIDLIRNAKNNPDSERN